MQAQGWWSFWWSRHDGIEGGSRKSWGRFFLVHRLSRCSVGWFQVTNGLHAAYVRKGREDGLWLWAMVENTWGVQIVHAITSGRWRIYQHTREQYSWMCPPRLQGKILCSGNTRDLAPWRSRIQGRIPGSLTSVVKSVCCGLFSAGQIWNWISVVLFTQHMSEKRYLRAGIGTANIAIFTWFLLLLYLSWNENLIF